MYPEDVDSPKAVDDECCDNDNKYDEECDEVVETVSQEVVNDTLKTPGL
jgi:hypothetical protein